MKQNITVDQLNKLSDKAKKRLREWWKPEEWHLYATFDAIEGIRSEGSMVSLVGNYEDLADPDSEDALPLLSIGQMIEFLEEATQDFVGRSDLTITCDESKRWFIYDSQLPDARKRLAVRRELCDALWDAMKEILEANKG